MKDFEAIRNQFPACEKYVYLNPAGGSPVSRQAHDAATGFYREMLEEGDIPYETWLERTEKTRARLASFIGGQPGEVAFTMNTSHGMNLIAQMLNPGKEVITMQDEFPSSTIPWIHHGYKLHFAKPEDHVYTRKSIEQVITPGTGILVSSYVQYNTGFRQDLLMLAEICREHNLVFVLNATQAMGVFPIDVSAVPVDFMVFTGLKWPMAGYGVGGMYVNSKHLGTLHFAQAGWQSVIHPEAMNNAGIELPSRASVLEPGVPHFPNIFALGAALDLLQEIGTGNISRRILELTGRLEKGLRQRGIEMISPLQEAYRSGITVIKIPEAGNVVSQLAGRKIIVAARGEGIRISVHIYNNENDIDAFLSALEEILDGK